MMLYICIKIHENILKGFRVFDGLNFQYSKFANGHNFVNNVGRVMILVYCTSSDHA